MVSHFGDLPRLLLTQFKCEGSNDWLSRAVLNTSDPTFLLFSCCRLIFFCLQCVLHHKLSTFTCFITLRHVYVRNNSGLTRMHWCTSFTLWGSVTDTRGAVASQVWCLFYWWCHLVLYIGNVMYFHLHIIVPPPLESNLVTSPTWKSSFLDIFLYIFILHILL